MTGRVAAAARVSWRRPNSARHLFSVRVAPMPAFSVASRPSNLSDIIRFRDPLDPWLAAIIATNTSRLYLFQMLQRTLSAGFIAPCLPSKTDKLPSGEVLPGCAQE